MYHHTFGGHHATGLAFGLRLHVEVRRSQRVIFAGAENLSLQALTSELAEMVSSLRVYSYAFRAQLEQVTSALQLNVECGQWSFAERAALDLASLLMQAHRRRLVKGFLAVRGADCALRIAELCGQEVR